jgi:hypothetical protein
MGSSSFRTRLRCGSGSRRFRGQGRNANRAGTYCCQSLPDVTTGQPRPRRRSTNSMRFAMVSAQRTARTPRISEISRSSPFITRSVLSRSAASAMPVSRMTFGDNVIHVTSDYPHDVRADRSSRGFLRTWRLPPEASTLHPRQGSPPRLSGAGSSRSAPRIEPPDGG